MVSPSEVKLLLEKFRRSMMLYRVAGGVHTAALCEQGKLVVIAEDIGRHNTLDKIQGECLIKGISTAERLLLTTGRVSSEMVLKAARMRIPVVISQRSPTSSAVELARQAGITLVGRARAARLSVYTHSFRIGREDDGAVH
jgi:FdhD protein